jgi:hypothetical protein
MAGDWIKMRVGLTTNPKVMRLAECLLENGTYLEWSALSYGMGGYPPMSDAEARAERHAALRVTRYVTVTALLRFWGYANEHIKGEFVAGIFPADVDEIVGVPGFADAIEAAGWAEFEPDGGMTLPNFSEHNTSAGERSSGAERQKRYRERKLGEAQSDGVTSDVTRDVTVTHREEKNREEKKEKSKGDSADADGFLRASKAPAEGPTVDSLLADVSPQVVADFKALRKAKKAAITVTAVEGIQREAAKAGVTLERALATCCERGWQSFKADWYTGQQSAPAGPTPPRRKELA